MSQRLGMADGRCFTINSASKLVNDYIMNTYGISLADNYAYRQLLQQKGPALIEEIQSIQKSEIPSPNSINQCQSCNLPLLKMPDIY